MENLKLALDYFRSIFKNPFENSRKRRAEDNCDHLNAKIRKIHVGFSQEDCYNKRLLRMSKSNTDNKPKIIVLDDDDDEDLRYTSKSNSDSSRSKILSTPRLSRSFTRNAVNGDLDEDVKIVREIKSSTEKRREANRLGFDYIKPCPILHTSFRKSFQNGIASDRSSLDKVSPRNSSDYSIRLNEKMQYKKLLENTSYNTSGNESSLYTTPNSSFNIHNSTSRSSRILNMIDRSREEKVTPSLRNSKTKLSTKDTIIKVLDDFDMVSVHDSDSEDEVVICPPSPKPDIKVEPVNSLRKIVKTSKESSSDWLQQLVDRHTGFINERSKEIEELRNAAKHHEKINRELKVGFIADRIKRSLSIKDHILPVEEVEEGLPELTEEHLLMVDKAFNGNPNEVLVRKFNLNITRRDLQTLAGLNWLNDEVINMYMNLIIERGKDSKWPKAYAMNTFFYSKLIKDGPQSLRRWTKKVDIFSYDIICYPIHLGMHWCMAIIDFRNKSIKYYDSMGSSNNRCLEALRGYLEAEHLDKKGKPYDTSSFELENVKDIPQQMNGSDCGMFSCTFAEFLSRNAKITFSQENMPYLRKKMVVEILKGELLIH